EDIIQISVQRVYNSSQVVEKEIAGYQIIDTLLHAYTQCYEREARHESGSYDKLIKMSFLPHLEFNPDSVYSNLINLCSEVASLTDGKALENYQKIRGFKF